MALLKAFAFMLLACSLCSCSGTYHAYADMFKLAFAAKNDVSLSYKVLSETPYDYLYVRQGEQAQVAMALMFIEAGKFKWISADRVMLITEHGRIVKTLGLANDLLHLTNIDSDPLKTKTMTANNWLRLADWQQGEYGYQLRSTFERVPNQTLEFFSHNVSVIKVIETVQYDNTANFVRLDHNWQNIYWLEATSGEVLKSQQSLMPGAEVFELVFISEVVRQLRRLGVDVAADAI
jgi:hypothetical protein